jgi:hypothetical protein
MRSRVILLLASCVPVLVGAQDAAPRADACRQAIRDYEARPRTVESERRVRLACYPGPGRSPALRDPVAVEGTTAKPLPVTPASPSFSLPRSPPVLTLCDTGGCWDNLGNRYNGTGSILYGPGGAPCTRSGDRIECR